MSVRFIVTFIVSDPDQVATHSLKALLKIALRRFGFRCTNVERVE